MSRFVKLTIENFQSHKYTEIDFHRGLNVFVGPSDSGKSAIIRALRWVLFNNPRGREMIREGANRCQVSLQLDDGTVIIRTRSKSVNRYTLITPDQEEMVFEGFGSEVPREIVEAHQIKPIHLEKQEIFLQVDTQLEGPFLLSESSGTKAKMIGYISGAHLIDSAIKSTKRDYQNLQSMERVFEEQIKEYDEKLLPYDNLDVLGEQLQLLEQRYQQIVEKDRRLQRWKELQAKLQEINQEQESLRKRLELYKQTVQLEERVFTTEQKAWKYKEIKAKADRFYEIRNIIEREREVLEKTSAIPMALERYDHLSVKNGVYEKLHHLRSQYRPLQKELHQTDHLLTSTKNLSEWERKTVHAEEIVNRYRRLKELDQKRQLITNEKQKHELTKKKTEALSTNSNQKLTTIDTLLQRLVRLIVLQEELQEKRSKLQIAAVTMPEIRGNVEKLTRQYTDLLLSHGNCPTCGTMMDPSTIGRLREELMGRK